MCLLNVAPWHHLCLYVVFAAAVKDTCIPQRLEMPSFTPPKHLAPTIYPTEAGVSSVCGREGETQMLSTAIKVTLDPQRDVKVRPSLSTVFFSAGSGLEFTLFVLFLLEGVPGCSSTSGRHHETLYDSDRSQLARAGRRICFSWNFTWIVLVTGDE